MKLTYFSNYRVLASSIALLATALAPTALGQTEATTTPVGFVSTTIPAAPSASAPSNSTISIPLYKSADFNGPVASITSPNQLTLTGANWTAGELATSAAPRFVRVKTSATASHVGKFFLVSANTATQLTVILPPGVTDLATVVTAGGLTPDTVEVLPANTLANLFGPNLAGATSVFTGFPSVAAQNWFKTGATADDADNLLVWSGGTWETYYNDNTCWLRSGNLAVQDNVIIYPDDGVFVIRRATTPLSLTLMGTVPSTTERTDLAGAGSTFIPNRFPVPVTLLDTGIHLTAGWLKGPSAADSDKVFIWEGTTWGTYYHDGSNWWKSGNLAIQDSKIIPVGAAMFITRSSAAQATLTQALPYTP